MVYADTTGLVNCTSDIKGTILPSGSGTINFFADEGYEFSEKGTFSIGSGPDEQSYFINVTKGSKTASYEYSGVYSNVRLSLTAIKSTAPVKYDFRTVLENCTVDYLESTISKGNHTFTLTANEGYEFTEKGTYMLGNPNLPYPTDDYEFFPVSKEVTTLTVEVDDMLTISLKATKKVESVSNFTLIYKTNDNELGQLSVERFHNEEDGSLKDYGENILKLYKLPFDVDIETIESKIQWGNVKSSVLSQKLTKTKFTLDLGVISIPEKYGNAFDYKNGEVEIFIPFIDSINIDLKTVMNKELHFSLVINLYSGQCTINIISNGEIVFSKETNISLDIPFIQTTTGSNFNSIKTYLINDIRKVKLVITRQIPKGTVFSSSDRLLGSDIHGYIEGDIISSKYDNMLSLDVYELQNKIRSGVKFK